MNKPINWIIRGIGPTIIIGACSLFGGGGGAEFVPSDFWGQVSL